MQSGKLDRRITLQTRVLTRNDQGEEVASYSDLAEVWAEKVDLRGREFFAAQQVNAEISTRFRIRYRSDITVLHRLVYSGQAYDIQHIAEIGRGVGLDLYTSAAL